MVCTKLGNCLRGNGLMVLRGPVGCGKSAFVHFIASSSHVNMPVVRVPFGKDLSQQSRLDNAIHLAGARHTRHVVLLTHMEQVFSNMPVDAFNNFCKVARRHPIVCTTDMAYYPHWKHLTKSRLDANANVINFPNVPQIRKNTMKELLARNDRNDLLRRLPEFFGDTRALVQVLKYGSNPSTGDPEVSDRFVYSKALMRGECPPPCASVRLDLVLFNLKLSVNRQMMLFILTNRTPMSKREMITRMLRPEPYVGKLMSTPRADTRSANTLVSQRPPNISREQYLDYAQCPPFHGQLVSPEELNAMAMTLSGEGGENRKKTSADKRARLMKRMPTRKAMISPLGSPGDLEKCVGCMT